MTDIQSNSNSQRINIATDNDFNRTNKTQSSRRASKRSTPNFTGKNSASDKANIKRMDAHQYEDKIQDLLELLEVQENKINEEYDKKVKLLHKLNDISQNNVQFQEQIENLNDNKLKQAEEIAALSQKLFDLNSKHEFVSINKFYISAK